MNPVWWIVIGVGVVVILFVIVTYNSLVSRKVQGIFKARGLNGTFFLVASSDWACAGEST